MGWLKEILDKFGEVVKKVDEFLGGAWSGLAHSAGFRYFTQKGLDARFKTMSSKDQKDPKVISAYEAATEDIDAGGMFAGFAEALFDGFAEIKDKIQDGMAEILKTSLKPGSPEVTKAVEGVMDTLLNELLKMMDPDGSKISEEMRNEYVDTMKPIMNLGLTFTIGTVLAELIHPTKQLGMGHISHFLYDTVGFKELMNAYIDPIRTNLVKQPTKYSINELTTPFIPRWGDAVEWYGRGHIDEDEMLGLMKKHGIVTDYAWLYGRMGTKPSSYFMLNAIGKEGLYNEDDFRFWLSDAGYGAFQITEANMSTYEKKYGLKPPSTTQIDFLAQSYKRMGERVDWLGMIPLAKKACREGLRSIDFFAEQLKRSYRKEEVNELEVELLEGDIKDDIDREYRKAYEKKYLAGRIDEKELVKRLEQYGLRPERAKARGEYFFVRKQGKLAVDEEEKMLSDAKIVNSYRYGLKEKIWALKGLDDKGYTMEDAELIVAAVDKKWENDAAKEWMRVYEQRMKFNVIKYDDLVAAYIDKGKDREWAEARATYVLEKTIGEPGAIDEVKTEKIQANIAKEWMRVYEQRAIYGEITEDELVAAYIDKGKDSEWAKTRATSIFEKIEERLMRLKETEVERLKRLEEAEAKRLMRLEEAEVEKVKRLEEAEVEKEKAELVKEWMRMIEQRATYGLIAQSELEMEYVELGKDPEWASTRATHIFEKIEEKLKTLEEAEVERVARLGIAEVERLKRLEEAEVEKEKAELVKESIRVMEQRAIYSLITEDALVVGYIGLGKDPEWAKTRATSIFEKVEERLIRLAEVEAKRIKGLEEAEVKKIEVTITKEWIRVLEQRATYGLIAQTELEKEYVELGKDPEWASVRATHIFEKIEEKLRGLEEAEKEKIKANITKEWIRIIELRATYGLMTQSELEKEYVKLGKDPEWAKTRATYIFEKVAGKPKKEEE